MPPGVSILVDSVGDSEITAIEGIGVARNRYRFLPAFGAAFGVVFLVLRFTVPRCTLRLAACWYIAPTVRPSCRAIAGALSCDKLLSMRMSSLLHGRRATVEGAAFAFAFAFGIAVVLSLS
jgi:hypothetical protein